MTEDTELDLDQTRAAWIIAIAAHQDRSAFAVLFEFYAPRIKSMMIKEGASADTGEIIARDALVTVWRKAEYFARSQQSASKWIYSIVCSTRGNHLRSQKISKVFAVENLPDAIEQKHPSHSIARTEVDAFALTVSTLRQRQSAIHRAEPRGRRPSSSLS